MKILVDADNCSRLNAIERIAKSNHIDVILYYDYSRTIESTYSELVQCDISSNSVDFIIVNNCSKGDIVITSDVGLASMAMVKGARVIKNSGKICTNKSISYDLNRKSAFMKTKRRAKHLSKINKANYALHDPKRYNFNKNLTRLIKENRS